ncbi:MAG: hypothetical protein V9G20_17660 [Candidatus Promineifilaceae bacterium]
MTRLRDFLTKSSVLIWLLLTLLVFTACSSPIPEPNVEADTDSTTGNSQSQQPYPPPEQQVVEEPLQASYPVPSPNATPVLATAVPTLVPPPICDIKPPVEIAMSYEETVSNFPAFSEPTIVATNNVGFSIAEWLPDNQRLLISQGDGAFGSISTLNVNTGEIVEYAQRRDLSGSSLIWLEEAQGVMFVDATPEGWELRFSDGTEVITLADELASVSITKDPANDQVATVFSSEPGAVMTVDVTGQADLITAIERNEETKIVPSSSTDGYGLAWSPNRIWLAQYKADNVYLVNTQTQEICALDLGDYGEAGRGQMFYAQWSPDGRYLSMAIKRQNPTPELNILDTESMELSILSIPLDIETWPPDSIGGSVWSPNSQMILLQTGGYDAEIGKTVAEWVLINIQSHQYTDILSNYKFLPGVGNIVWSHDGTRVAYSCHTTEEGNICLINVSQ